MSRRPSVCAIVVRYASDSPLEACLASLKRSSVVPDEVCIIDNRPSDGLVAGVEQRFPDVAVYPQTHNIGFAAGCNEGIRRTKSELVFIVNDDTTVHPHCIKYLVAAFEKNPRLGACQPKILSAQDPSCFEYAGSSGGFLDMFGVPFLRGRIIDTVEKDRGQYDDEREVFWASGAALMLRRSVLDEVGLFDEAFFAHQEEIDLCWRMHMMGFSVRAVPQAIAYHIGGGTLPYTSPLKTFYNYRNSWRLMVKNFCLWPLVIVLPSRLLLDLGTVLYFLAKGKPRHAFALAKALVCAFASLRSTLHGRARVQSVRKMSESGLHDLIYRRPLLIDYFFWRKRTFSQLHFPRSRLLMGRTSGKGRH
ncbi:MAG: glycosyltransferase family 2 protein [Candidatus Coatesbacteria bacterium]|nr:MAG: glycosyltransferase family 2 protein [Candidatus Coatesbacteria bacterium]